MRIAFPLARRALGIFAQFFAGNAGKLAVAGALLLLTTIPSSRAETVAGYDIIVVAGQSNAAGAGIPDRNAQPHGGQFDDRIMQVGRFGRKNHQVIPVPDVSEVQPGDGLEHWGKPRRSRTRTGFSRAFAEHYAASVLHADRQVLIVPAARGSTSISEWIGDPDFVPRKRAAAPLYRDMIERVRTALQQPGDNRVVAFLWHQGEADINRTRRGDPAMDAARYERALRGLLSGVQRDIPGTYPIVLGKYTPDWLANNSAGLRTKRQFERVLEAIAADSGRIGLVATAGLQSNYGAGLTDRRGQQVHFSGPAAAELGGRYFTVWACILAAHGIAQQLASPSCPSLVIGKTWAQPN